MFVLTYILTSNLSHIYYEFTFFQAVCVLDEDVHVGPAVGDGGRQQQQGALGRLQGQGQDLGRHQQEVILTGRILGQTRIVSYAGCAPKSQGGSVKGSQSELAKTKLS